MDLVAPGTVVIVEAEFDSGLAQQQTAVGAGRVRAACPPQDLRAGKSTIDDGVAEGGDDSSRGKRGFQSYSCTYLSCSRSHEG
jgi:hypothetical protein